MARPIGGHLILGGAGGGDDEHLRRDDTRGDDDHTDVAQTGSSSNCVRGYARFMLAVWAGRDKTHHQDLIHNDSPAMFVKANALGR